VTQPVRIAVVGACGHSRSNHGASLARFMGLRSGEAELIAVCDLDRGKAEAFARDFGLSGSARVHTDMHEMMQAEKPDGCITVMNIDNIVPVALDLLQYRVPLMVEKPPGRTPADCARLRDAAAETGVEVQVSVNRRFQSFLSRGLAWAREQGEILFISGAMLRSKRREAGFLTDTGIHIIDAMRYLGGDVETYKLHGGRGAEHGQLWFAASLHFASGAPGLLQIHPDCGMVAERYELRGEGFSVEVGIGPLCDYTLRCRRHNEDVIFESLPADAPYEIASGCYEETVAFIESIRDGRPLHPSPADVLPSMELAHEIRGCLERVQRA